MESFYNVINIETRKKEMVCLVGAGGKTSAMFCLARELSAKGKKILATTTTAIYYPESEQYDKILISEKESLDLFYNINDGITVLGRSVSPEGKLLGVSPEFLDVLFYEELFDYILVEGDGSKGRSIKAPAGYEPVIPSCTTKVLGLIGLDSIGRKISSEYVHRPELFCSILGCREGDIIDAGIISKLIAHREGLFKASPALAERYVILNKAEGEERRNAASDIKRRLSDMGYNIKGIVISSMKDSKFIINAAKGISGIILASGLSRRMGADKLLFPVGGVPVIERVIAVASKSGLIEVVLVCTSDSVASIGRKYGAKIVKNNAPELGQSHSIRLGVENSCTSTDGFMFLVGDQPFINESIINDLVDSFVTGSTGAAVPLYNGIRGNPVIFSSSQKDKLLNLCGDSGGRVLLEGLKGNITTVCFADGKLGLDIDTREDYEKVVKLEDENE